PDDPRAFDRGELEQRLFDLLRADVGAVVHDDLLLAPAEPQVAVFIRPHDVAGIEPARPDGLGGGIGPVPVSDHVAPRADPKAALGAGRQLGAALVPDRTLVTRIERPDRTELVGPGGRIQVADPI